MFENILDAIMSSLTDIIGLNTPVRSLCESTLQNRVKQGKRALSFGFPAPD